MYPYIRSSLEDLDNKRAKYMTTGKILDTVTMLSKESTTLKVLVDLHNTTNCISTDIWNNILIAIAINEHRLEFLHFLAYINGDIRSKPLYTATSCYEYKEWLIVLCCYLDDTISYSQLVKAAVANKDKRVFKAIAELSVCTESTGLDFRVSIDILKLVDKWLEAVEYE